MGHYRENDRNGWHHYFKLSRLNLVISQHAVWDLGFRRGWRTEREGPIVYFWSIGLLWCILSITGRESEPERLGVPFWIF